jgi:molybdenum cofactor synthesis domain-containing protein
MSGHPVRAAVLTVSDRCARDEMRDTAGPAVAKAIEAHLGAAIVAREIVPDDPDAIAAALRRMIEAGADLIATAGGTGCGPRDLTPEATRAVISREVPGLAEAMRAKSAAITPFAYLQRGICGIAGSTLIVNLPGSEKGAVENFETIASVLPHALQLLRGDTTHPASERDRSP